MRKAGVLALIAGIALMVFAAAPAYADPPGFNGTVKIHDEPEHSPAMENDPHVCVFHIHGFNFDAGATGWWKIFAWPPTGDGSTVVSSGTWGPASASGEWRTASMTLPDGHYKLQWDQTAPAAPGGEKQKVFWVDCASSSTTSGTTTAGTTTGTTTGGTTTGTTTGTTGTTTAGTTTGTTTGGTTGTTTGTTGTTTAGTTTGTTTGGTTGTTTAGTTTAGTTTAGTTTAGTTTAGTTTAGTTTAGTTGTTTGGTAIATTGGQGNVTGGETSVSTTGGATAGAEANVNTPNGQTAASGVTPSVANLPSTSTSGHGDGVPFAAFGAFLIGAGAFLWRRSITNMQ